MTNSHIVKNTTITVTEMENCTDMAVPIFHRGSAIGVCNSQNFNTLLEHSADRFGKLEVLDNCEGLMMSKQKQKKYSIISHQNLRHHHGYYSDAIESSPREIPQSWSSPWVLHCCSNRHQKQEENIIVILIFFGTQFYVLRRLYKRESWSLNTSYFLSDRDLRE